MRLAQLARKISVKPSDITEFLADNNIQIENNSNTKIADDHVVLVINHFAPEMVTKEEVTTAESEISINESSEQNVEDISVIIDEVQTPDDIKTSEGIVEVPEVIKPIKVELPGLKVVGKIDLPEPKKKELKPLDENTDEAEIPKSDETTSVKTRFESRNRARHRQDLDRRPRKNPIALQREREEREALKRKLEQKEKQKELRTQRYLKKVSGKVAAPKPVRKNRRNDDYEVLTDFEEKPKTVLGKILNWFVSK